MATTSDTTAVSRGPRRLRIAVAAAAVMVLAACTGPAEGTFDSSPATTATESATPELVFDPDVPEDICPDAEAVPADLAAPESIGYEFDQGPRESGSYEFHECTYLLDGEIAGLDGAQALERIVLQFYVTDGSPLELIHSRDYSAVDFDQVEAAEYFRDWDQAVDKSEIDLTPGDRNLEESQYAEFHAFASLDNLYVQAYIAFVVTEENPYLATELDIDDAAYRVLEAIVAPAVDNLDRH